MATSTDAFGRPVHVLSVTVNKSSAASDPNTTTFTWSARINTSGNTAAGPFGTGSSDMSSSPATTHVSGRDNNKQAFAYDYRAPNQNYSIALGSGVRSYPSNGAAINWTFTATMGLAGSASVTIALPANAAPGPAPSAFTNTPYVQGTVGNSYSDVVISVGSTAISRSGNLPPGLTGAYESATQGYRVTGTPTTASTYPFTLTATNANGSTTYSASIVITNPPPPPPSAPGAASISNSVVTDTTFRIDYGSSAATNYDIYLKQGSGTETRVANKTSSITYTASGLLSNTEYTFRVVPFTTNANGTSGAGTSASSTQITLRTPITNVPNVVGSARDSGITTLANAGFIISNIPERVTLIPNASGATIANNRKILTQAPTAGTTNSPTPRVGDTASISVYDYKILVPNILGQVKADAESILKINSFFAFTSAIDPVGATVANNKTVKSSTPANGTLYNVADNVHFVLYDFKAAIPPLVGKLQEAAQIELSDLGFKNVVVTPDEVGATIFNVNKVKSQTPVNSATTYNPQDTQVSLVVYSLGITGTRFDGQEYIPLSTAKRFADNEWIPLTVQKRFDGQNWIDISN